MARRAKPREMGGDQLEPFCGECRVGYRGETFCICGWTREERLESGWKRDGTNPKPPGKRP
jgi:hypothetical protein